MKKEKYFPLSFTSGRCFENILILLQRNKYDLTKR